MPSSTVNVCIMTALWHIYVTSNTENELVIVIKLTLEHAEISKLSCRFLGFTRENKMPGNF